MSEPSARLGLLLVHGIGDQREGETLSSFGEPLVDWMQEWLFGTGHQRRGRLKWSEARVRAAGNDKERPAYARVEFETPGVDSEAPERDSFLICEAHWGESVQPPEAFALMRWLFTRGPLVIYWHFYLNTRRRDLGRQSLRRDSYPLVALTLAVCVQLVVGLGMLLLAIPIGSWRAGVLRVVRLLTLTLGDSYVLLERELQHAALVQNVRDALKWLGDRVERIVVIAHSQGAALGHEALSAAPHPERVALFVTLGSGLEKLQFLQLVRWNRHGILHATLIAPLLVVATGLLIHGSKPIADSRWELAMSGGLALVAFVCWAKLRGAFIGYRDLLAQLAGKLKLPCTAEDFEWLDLYTRHDIVPMGAASQLHAEGVVKSIRTHNEGSYLRDHVRYFARHAGCLSILWHALARHTPLRLFSDQDRDNLARLTAKHRRDVFVLINARVGLVIAAIGSTVAIRERLADLGASLVLAVDQGPFGDWFKPIVKLRDAACWGFEHAGASRPSALAASHIMLGALAPLSGLFIWWLAFRATTGALGASRWRSVVRSVDAPALVDTRARFYGRSAVAVVAAYLPVLVAVLLYLAPGLLTLAAINKALTVVLTWVFLLTGGWLLLAGPWLASRDVFNDKKSWFDRAVTSLAPLCLALVFLGLTAWMERANSSPGQNDFGMALVSATYGVLWQVFALHRLRRTLRPAWLVAVFLLPPLVASARFLIGLSSAALNEAFYYYLFSVFAVLGAAAFIKNRAAISAAFLAEWGILVKRLRTMRLR